MIQSSLFFALGFLAAGLIALLIAPAIWNRAVRLTKRRIEAKVPLTLSDIQADKDRMRAEFAISTRRLEITIKDQREKAAQQLLELNHRRNEAKSATDERDRLAKRLEELEATHAQMRKDFEERERQLALVADKLAVTSEQLDEKTIELSKLELLFEDASLSSSSRQIELVARESDLDRLTESLKKQRAERKELDKELRETAAENRKLKEELRLERKRLDSLEQRTEALVATLSDREDRLERRERDLARLRERVGDEDGHVVTALPVQDDPRIAALEAEIERLRQAQPAAPVMTDASAAETAHVEARLEAVREENRKLREQLTRLTNGEDAAAILRDQISDLAAKVVHLTALAEGPASPLNEMVAEREDDEEGHVSLATRIRALQEAARA